MPYKSIQCVKRWIEVAKFDCYPYQADNWKVMLKINGMENILFINHLSQVTKS